MSRTRQSRRRTQRQREARKRRARIRQERAAVERVARILEGPGRCSVCGRPFSTLSGWSPTVGAIHGCAVHGIRRPLAPGEQPVFP
jgi:hypothetical protein